MKKRALLALLLAATLLLSSCALIVKDAEVDAKTVILKMGEKEITKAEVQAAVNNVLAQYTSYYGSSVDVTSAEVIASAQEEAVHQLKEDMVLRAKAKELGLEELTEEETAQAKETAQGYLETALNYIKNYLIEDDTLEGEALDKAAEEKLDELGVSLEDYEKSAADSVRDQKLRDYIVKDVTVPDEDVKADYDAKVAADQEKYTTAGAWASAANGSSSATLYYTPAGIRRVKQILIKFKDADQAAIDEANANLAAATSKVSDAQEILDNEEATAEEKAEAEASKNAAEDEVAAANTAVTEAIETGFANLDADADTVLAALEADPDSWDQLTEEWNQDPGMKSGTTAEKGYAISADMTSFDHAFVEAGMALKNIGDVSGKIRGTSYGYYIIKYVADEPEGPVDYDSVAEALRSALLSTKQSTLYNETVEQWVDEANIQENLGALKD